MVCFLVIFVLGLVFGCLRLNVWPVIGAGRRAAVRLAHPGPFRSYPPEPCLPPRASPVPRITAASAAQRPLLPSCSTLHSSDHRRPPPLRLRTSRPSRHQAVVVGAPAGRRSSYRMSWPVVAASCALGSNVSGRRFQLAVYKKLQAKTPPARDMPTNWFQQKPRCRPQRADGWFQQFVVPGAAPHVYGSSICRSPSHWCPSCRRSRTIAYLPTQQIMPPYPANHSSSRVLYVQQN